MQRKLKGILILIVGIVFAWIVFREVKIIMSPAQDVYEMNCNELEQGMHVTGNVDFVYDYYASQTTEKKRYGVTVSTENDTKRWYIFPAYGATEEETKLLTLEVSKANYGTMDDIVEETWAYIDGETDQFGTTVQPINAKVWKLDSDLYELYYDWYGAENREQAEEYFVPYKLIPVMEKDMLIVFGVISVLFIVIGLAMFLWKDKRTEPVNVSPEPVDVSSDPWNE
nr:hypothetical protein [Lachnospiraceae bacterium]